MELPAVLRKRASDSNISQVTKREKWVKATPNDDRGENKIFGMLVTAELRKISP